MSDKKPAARDISDLKARLGLKKKGPSRPATTGNGVVAPPGAAIPAPPGAAPPQPAIPDASRDPFGAMNAMAAHTAHVRGPEIIVVNDGAPVESVEKKTAAMKYGKIAAFILGPLVVGVAIGQISSSAKRSNEVIEDAAVIRDDLKKLNTQLVNMRDILLDAKTRGAGGQGYKLNDQQLTKDLEAFDFPKIDPKVVYESAMYELPVEVVENLLYFYAEMSTLREELFAHVEAAKRDAKAIDEAGNRLAEKFGRGLRYGAIISMPSAEEAQAGMPPKAQIVELGPQLCPDGSSGQCSVPPVGFGVRTDDQVQSWTNKKFPAAGTVDASGLLLLDPTPVFTSAVAGADATVAQTMYMQRIGAIDEKVERLTEIGNKLASQLNAKSNESKKFTFFL